MTLTVLDVAEWFGDTSGGIRTYLLAKSAYVRAREHLRQVLVLPGPRDERSDDGAVSIYRLRGPRLPRRGQYRLLLAVNSLREIIDRERPDVIEVESMMLAPWVLALAAHGTGIPRLAFYHENIEHRFAFPRGAAPGWRELSRGPLRWYLRHADRFFDARVAASESLCEDLTSAGITSPLRVPLGVDSTLFHPSRRHRGAATRLLLDLPADGALVGYVGRLAAEKELPLLLRAWPAIEDATGASLLVLGDGPLRQRVTQMSGHRRVHFRPFRAERELVADALAMLDVAVTPGSIETFGLAQLEAIACGTPVVAARAGAAGELVLRSGAGRTFEPGDASALARVVCELLHDREARARLGSRGPRFAEREHSWDRVFDMLFAVYDVLRRERPRRPAPRRRWSAPRVSRWPAPEGGAI